jgi:hypothetical protein
MIESAIVGRGVYVLLAKRYRDTQAGAPHFAHLRSAGGGLIDATTSVEEHTAGLARALRGEDADEVARRSEAFLSDFIRPCGMDIPATPILVSALERLAETDVAPVQHAPGPPEEQLQAAIDTLEPIFGIRPPGRINRPSPAAPTTPAIPEGRSAS